MISVTDEVLNGEPTYTITYSDSTTSSGVKIDLDTQVVTEGTALNKALFDSIDADIQARLLISSKSTTSEAKSGTNDTKYITPLKVQQKLDTLMETYSVSSSTTTTLVDGSSISGSQIITIDAKMTGGLGSSYYSKFKIDGTGIMIFEDGSIDGSGTSVDIATFINNNTRASAFHLEINTYTKTLSGWALYGASLSDKKFQGYYTTLTSISNVQNYAGITSNISVRYSSLNPNA